MTKLLLRDLWVGALLIALLITLGYLFHLDDRIANYYFDASSHSFPLKSSWLFQDMLHDQLKKLPVVVALILLLRLIYLLCRRRYADMSASGYLFVAMALGTGLVGLIRAHSPVACPWALASYGGDLPFMQPWQWFQGGVGHCWPSGHAAGGFCLLAFFFWLRAHASRWAFPVLALVLTIGAIMGWAQLVRGAHFLSHVSWSLLFCWLVSGGLACLWWRQRN